MSIYYSDSNLIIRPMLHSDIEGLYNAFRLQGWNKPLEILTGYFEQQQRGDKKIIVAEIEGQLAGYVTLLPAAEGGPFSAQKIPEIVDFNVFIRFQRRGIGNKIMDIAEQLASQASRYVSLSVGLHQGYGTAQRMYIKRGYIPDGTGVWYSGKPLEPYTACVNDDDLVLYYKKDLTTC